MQSRAQRRVQGGEDPRVGGRLRTARRAARLAAWVIAAAGCRSVAPTPAQVAPWPGVVGCAAAGCAPPDEQVTVTYLGVGGFLVRYRGAALLTAPFFSTPPLRAVSLPGRLPLVRRRLDRIAPDTTLIERLLPAAADGATMILVGHAHYDHLLDVPYVARRRSTRAVVYGSPTTRHVLMGDPALRATPARVVAIDADAAGSADRPGRWYYSPDSTFRIMGLAADHAPTLALRGWRPLFAAGVVARDLTALPAHAQEWKAGEPLAFLIDVLRPGDARPRLRLYYQDAPSTPPLGFPPHAVLAERPVDVAILCAATASHVPHTPDRLVAALRPAHVLVGHWESFFRPQTRPAVLNPTTDARRFFAALARHLPPGAGWQMPLPQATVRFDLR